MHNIRVLSLYKLTMIICVHRVYGSMIVMVMHALVCTVCDTLYAKKCCSFILILRGNLTIVQASVNQLHYLN